MTTWKEAVRLEWERRIDPQESSTAFPLMQDAFTAEDILEAVDVLLSGRLTMADRVRKFERTFADYVGAPYAVMVNSGSSANLLATAVAVNPARSLRIEQGAEVIVPAVCWSTSVWPLVQAGLQPVFADVDPATLNVSLESVHAAITPRTRAIMAVHVLGNSCDVEALASLAAERQWVLIEDTCESLGSRFRGRTLGTFGSFGTYSFYYSHHMTTGEGGMVVCRDAADYDLLKCLRAHGWSRELSDRQQIEAANPGIDPRFLFVNVGYNVRPTEVQAAIGLSQLERLTAMNETRNDNRTRVISALRAHPQWREQFSFAQAGDDCEPAWFGLTLLLQDGHVDRADYLGRLTARGIENRPIISGNFTRQPAWQLVGTAIDPLRFPGAELLHHRGFFIGVHASPLDDAAVNHLAATLLEAFPS